MADEGLPDKDVDPLPGPAKSWAKGEPIPSDMPNADAGTAGLAKADDVSKGLATIQRERMSALEGSYKNLSSSIDKGTQRLEEAYKNEGVNPADIKPFDEKAATARNTTDPIAAFGSFASVFGILASTFTHAPFESALNASAAAMNAIKAGDKEGFERERKAWEENTKLALDKHKIQHEAYMDAATLLKTNMEAGEAKMRVLAARFGDQKTLYLLENGMSKEVLDLQQARENLHAKLAENAPKIIMANAEISRLFALGYDPKHPETEQSQDALVKFQKEKAELKRESSPYFGRATSATTQQEFIQRRMQEIRDIEHREPNADDMLHAQEEWTKVTTKGTDTKERGLDLKAAADAERARHNKAIEDIQNGRGDVSAKLAAERERHDRAMENISTIKGSSATSLTKDRQIAQDVNKLTEKYKNDHPGASEEEVADYRAHQFARLSRESAAITGNRADDLRGKIGQVEVAETTIGHIEDMLKKHNAITGLGGKITRPGEVVSNIFGGNETDRKQFERWVSELQEIAPRILLDSKGRPLSSEAGRVEKIIAGLQFGDTTANTARAYYEFKKVLDQIKGNLGSRLKGGSEFDERFEGAAPARTPPKAEQGWDAYPVVH